MTTIPVKLKRDDGSSVRRVRARRDFQAMEERRMRAADLFEQGVRPAEIGRQLGVWHQIVSDWRAVWRRSGRDGLRGAGRAGRLPKLSRDQLAHVESELIKGAEANGYPNDVARRPGSRPRHASRGRARRRALQLMPDACRLLQSHPPCR